MTREAFKQILRNPETTKMTNRWAEEDRIAAELAVIRQRELNEAVYLAWIHSWFSRTDPPEVA